ncbi:MAG: hypothetical protein ABL874_06140 [Sphingopyxis sp.]
MLSVLFAPTLFAMSMMVAQDSGDLSPQDQARAFAAAGFTQSGGQWRSDCADTSAAYTPGAIDLVDDLDGDGKPEAFITESSAACYGAAGTAFVLVSKQSGGTWRLLLRATGYATPLSGRGIVGLPDIEVGGPGTCFPVYRWNDHEYAIDRHQYEGQPCQP